MVLPSKVNIETNTYCNRNCPYCPPKGENIRLEEKYVLKIIDELSKQNLRKISFQGYNEPLTDSRLKGFIAYARERLPDTIINVPTNGDLLDLQKTQELIDAGLDELKITIHEPATEDSVNNIHRLQKFFREISILDLRKGYKHHKLSNRGGSVKLEKPTKVLGKCPYTRTMTIKSTGNVVLCCQDFYQTEIFGNIKTQNTLEIWNSKKFKDFRTQSKNGKFPSKLCQICEEEI